MRDRKKRRRNDCKKKSFFMAGHAPSICQNLVCALKKRTENCSAGPFATPPRIESCDGKERRRDNTNLPPSSRDGRKRRCMNGKPFRFNGGRCTPLRMSFFDQHTKKSTFRRRIAGPGLAGPLRRALTDATESAKFGLKNICIKETTERCTPF